MLLGFAGFLVSGFFLSQGYSIFSTLYFALAAAMGRLQSGSTYPDSTEVPFSSAKANGMARPVGVGVHDAETRMHHRGEGSAGRRYDNS
jgi:hypothetical protein